MPKIKTHEEFVNEISKINPNIEILGKYTRSRFKILCKCKICNHEFETQANNLKYQGCPTCGIKRRSNKLRKTKEQFIEQAKKIHGNKYNYDKVEYINDSTKVLITCLKHGDWLQTPSNHLQGCQCPECAKEQNSDYFTKDWFVEKANKIHNYKYNYSKVEYTKSKNKVIIICPEHGEFWQRVNDHLKGKGCPKCSGNYSYTTEEWISLAKEKHGNKYDYSKVNYINSNTKVCIICPKHGEFWQNPCNHLSGYNCPKCNQSHGEEFIENYLNKNNISYIKQFNIKVVNSSFNANDVFIDFYLPEYNTFIEYNGVQHYIPIEYFGGKLKFENYQIPRDNYVKEYCNKNNITLIEIPYTYSDKDIITTLENIYK